MTDVLFKEWMMYFLQTLSEKYGLSPSNRHLLILNGHKSHVTLEVIKLTMSQGLDLLTLPSHASHALQLLDVTCFKPFKMSFRAYRDKWTVDHKGQMPIKENLAQWVSWGLRRALSTQNITKGFLSIGIYPIDATTINLKMTPSEVYDRSQIRAADVDSEDSRSTMEPVSEL